MAEQTHKHDKNGYVSTDMTVQRHVRYTITLTHCSVCGDVTDTKTVETPQNDD